VSYPQGSLASHEADFIAVVTSNKISTIAGGGTTDDIPPQVLFGSGH
jgi:hypothetical protein